jgi:cytoskeletal protein CcmA (bactofilin family)
MCDMGTRLLNKFKYPKSDHAPRVGHETDSDDPRASSGEKTMIGAGVKVVGQITSDEDLFIEGKLEGTVLAVNQKVRIGKSGCLKANITAGIVRIDGIVKGDVSGIEQVVISKTGNVLGNILSPRVTLEDGAKFKGSIEMDPGDRGALPVAGLSDVKSHKVGSKAS